MRPTPSCSIGAGIDLHRRRRHQRLRQLKTPERSLERSLGRTRCCDASRTRPSRSSPPSTATRSAADSRSRWRVTSGSPPRTRAWASRKCCSASSPAPAAPSGCRGCAARPWRSRCAPDGKPLGAPRRPRRHHRPRRRRRPARRRDRVRERASGGARDPQGARDLDHLGRRSPGGVDACEATRVTVDRTPGHPRAPAAVDAIEAGLTLPFDAGSIRERELFAECVVSTESKALRHLFFAEREASKVPGVPKDTPTRDIRAPRSSAPAPWAAASR